METKRDRRGAAWWIFAFVVCTFLTIPVCAQPTVEVIREMRWIPSTPDGAPDEARALTVKLPDDLNARGASSSNSLYRSPIPRVTNPAATSLYLPGLHAQVRVSLNGHRLFESGGFEEPPPSGWNLARIVDIPPEYFRESGNELAIEVGGRPARFIGAPEIGDRATLHAKHRAKVIGTAIAPMALATVISLIGVFVIVLWLHQKGDTLYGYFGAATLLWGLHTAWKASPIAPFPVPHNLILWTAGYVFWVLLFVIFFVRYTGRPFPRLTRVLWSFAVGGFPLLYAAHYAGHFPLVSTAWRAVAILWVFAGLAIVTRFAWRERRVDSFLLMITAMVAAGFAVHDWSVALAGKDVNPVWLVPYSGLAFVLLFGWLIVNRFNHGIDALAQGNAELAERVAKKSAEIERQHARLLALEQQQAADEARAHVLSDMHDGLGAKLMISLRSLERGEISPAEAAMLIEECIEELRLAVDATSDHDGDLAGLLASLRYRLGDRLRTAGLNVDWKVRHTPPLDRLRERGAQDLLRIAQEFLNNTLKHSGADQVSVETIFDAMTQEVSLTLADNGRGFDLSAAGKPGHGLANMRQRANAMGAAYELSSGISGTVLKLTWAIDLQARSTKP